MDGRTFLNLCKNELNLLFNNFPRFQFQLVDEEFDALEGFFYLLENGIAVLHENVETYLSHLQVSFCRPHPFAVETITMTALESRCLHLAFHSTYN